jgi:hypothetical protein
MKTLLKFALFALALFGIFLVIRHGNMAMQAAIPKDMPPGAHFVQSGYNVSSNEPTGNWLACWVEREQAANRCRVTDQKGMVIFEDFYLPLDSSTPAPEEQLRIIAEDAHKLWVTGSAEGTPVPVIPLANGRLLVPVADRELLINRWKQDPTDYERLMAPEK